MLPHLDLGQEGLRLEYAVSEANRLAAQVALAELRTKVPGAVGGNGIGNILAIDGQEYIRLSNGMLGRLHGRAE